MNTDPHRRTIDYLRISVTDRCNEKCLYCMPQGYQGWACTPDRMTADDIVAVARAAAGLGFRKIRLTGGEPLVRRDLVEIAGRFLEIPGIEALGLSTNVVLLSLVAHRLQGKQLERLQV